MMLSRREVIFIYTFFFLSIIQPCFYQLTQVADTNLTIRDTDFEENNCLVILTQGGDKELISIAISKITQLGAVEAS